MAQHTETFKYNNNDPENYSDWEIDIDVHSSSIEISSSGTATKTSGKFNLNHINSTITASVTGGWGVADALNPDSEIDSDSLKCDLYVELWFEKANGTATKIKTSGVGSAERGGDYDAWHVGTTGTLSYTPTASDRSTYSKAYFVYHCSTSSSYESVTRYGPSSFEDHKKGQPYGIVSFTVRDNINVDYKSGSTTTTMQDLIEDGTDIRKLVYNGSTIYQ